MKIEEYFNEKCGIFTALAIFIAFTILSEEKSLFLSFSGFFISFILISYLLNEMGKIDKLGAWDLSLWLGYNLLFVALFLYGIDKFKPLFTEPFLTVLIILGVVIYGRIAIKYLLKR